MKHPLFAAAIFACLSLPSTAQIRYTDILPDTLLSATLADPWANYSADIDADGSADFTITQFHPSSDVDLAEINCRQVGGSEFLVDGEGVPRRLGKDTPIAGGAADWFDSGSNAVHMSANWAGARDGYLAVRVRRGGGWLYGWIRLDVAANEQTISVKDFACEMTPDKSIAAGSTGLTPVAPTAAPGGLSIRAEGSILLIRAEQGTGSIDWILSDRSGKIAAQGVVESEDHRIDLAPLGTGVYFIRLHGRGSAAFGKVLLAGGSIRGIALP